MPKRLIAGAVAWLVPAVTSAQMWSGPEFQVNSHTTAAQLSPAIASDATGRFLVAWSSEGQDGSDRGIIGRLFDARGPATPEFQVNAWTTGAQDSSSVAAAPDGSFCVSWNGVDAHNAGLLAQRYEGSGALRGGNFVANSYTTGWQTGGGLAFDASGNFVAVWSNQVPGYVLSFDVWAQRYTADGEPAGASFRVNTYTTGHQGPFGVASDGAGNFLVVWESGDQDGSGDGVFGRVYDAAGAPKGDEFRINAYTTFHQRNPAVAASPRGGFVVTWDSEVQDGSYRGIYAQRLDSDGSPLGGEFRVNAHTHLDQSHPAVTFDGGGRFIVTWIDQRDPGLTGVFGQRFARHGATLDDAFQVNVYTTGAQLFPAVAADGSGRFVVVWTSDGGQDGDAWGIFGRRFVPDLIFEDGFESSDVSEWSSAGTGGGDLQVTGAAALASTTRGLEALVDDVNGLYVVDETPHDEPRYRARFWLDPNGFDPGESLGHRRTRMLVLFAEAPSRRIGAVVLRRLGGAYSLMARARVDDNSQVNTPWVPITDGPHAVEIDWRQATGPDALDGGLELWIDGVSVAALSGLDNASAGVEFVRLGAIGVKPGANGTLYWDEFESRRQGPIRP